MVKNSTFNRGQLKKRLYDEGFKEPRCELCGQDEFWHGTRVSLILDHINGNGRDHVSKTFASFARTVPPRWTRTADATSG